MQHRMTLIVVSVLAGLCLWAAPASADGDGIRCQVTTPVLRVRSAPDESQIGTAYGGTWLTVTARDSDTAWAKVDWSGRDGWVSTQWLRCDSSLDDLAEAEADADTTPTVAAAASSPAKSVTPPSPPGLDPRAKAMFDAVNQVRAKAGLRPYNLDLRAMDAAQWQADDMVARRYFAHNTPEGLTPSARMRARGLPCPGWCGENMIMGQGRDEIAYSINWFMNSTIHRANLLSRQYTGIGIGVATSRSGVPYYILDFFGE